jgi:hypothetical protein
MVLPQQTAIEEMKFAPGSLRNSLSARVFVDLRFKAISSCPVFESASRRGTSDPSREGFTPFYATGDQL